MNVGSFGDEMVLEFDPDPLKTCESNQVFVMCAGCLRLSSVRVQLRMLGHLVDKGALKLNASDDTICFTVDQDVVSEMFNVEVLTVVNAMPQIDLNSLSPNQLCRVSSPAMLAAY